MQFVERNGNNYKHLLFGQTLSEHLECMKKPFVWGTQLEIQAAADYDGDVYLSSHQETAAREVPSASIHTTQDQYTLIPSLMLPHFRFRSVVPQLDGATVYVEDILYMFHGLLRLET